MIGCVSDEEVIRYGPSENLSIVHSLHERLSVPWTYVALWLMTLGHLRDMRGTTDAERRGAMDVRVARPLVSIRRPGRRRRRSLALDGPHGLGMMLLGSVEGSVERGGFCGR